MTHLIKTRWLFPIFLCLFVFNTQAANVNITGYTATDTFAGYPLFEITSPSITVSSTSGLFNYVYIDGVEVAHDSDYWSSYTVNISSFIDGRPHKLQLTRPYYDVGVCYFQSPVDLAVDGVFYTIEGTFAAVSGCLPNIENAVILDEYEHENIKYPVTKILTNAFNGCTNLKSVTIPNSVTTIAKSAFARCSGLTSVSLPNSVTEIGKDAFSNCSNLHSLTLGSGLLNIESQSNFTPQKVIWLANTPPSGYKNITGEINYVANSNYSFSTGTTYIYPHLSSKFEIDGMICVPVNPAERTCDIIDCSYSSPAENISIGKTVSYRNIQMTVKNVREYAFYDNDFIKTVIVDYNGKIPERCFYDCNNINSLSVLQSVGSIGDYAFYNCAGLLKANLQNTGSIGYYTFQNCSNIETLSVAPTVTDINNYAFSGCSSILELLLQSTGSIGNYAFYGCSNIETLTIAPTVTNIYSYAFSCCTSIAEINLQNTGSIADNAFEYCVKAKSLTIAKTVTTIGSYAFQNCSGLTNINLQNSGSIGYSAFKNCSGLININLQNAGSIGSYAFQNCSSAKTATVGPNVTSIGNYAFYGCKSLADITFQDSKKSISLGSNGNNSMFSSCPLDEVYIGRELNYSTSNDYGYSPFYRNTSLRSVEITDEETQIYDNEFYGCSNLQSVSIGDGVTSFGKYAFSGCSALESFEFGKSVKTIGLEAFSDCTALTNLTSHNPTPPTCGTEALDDINKWECTLHVPASAIDAYMAADQWKNFFFIEDDANKIFEFEGLIYKVVSANQKTVEIVSSDQASASMASLLSSRTELTEINIKPTVEHNGSAYTVKGIGERAFCEHTSLAMVSLPATIEYVGTEAFADCPNLTEVTIHSENPPTASENAFHSTAYANAKLKVPEKSVDLYKSDNTWNRFFAIEPAAIDGVFSDEFADEVGRYNLQGLPVDSSYHGFIIIRYSNGKVRKHLIP